MRAALDGAAAAAGRRPPHPDRDGQLADAGRADPRAARRASRRRSGIQWEPAGRAQRPRGQPRSRSASTSTRSTASSKADVILSLDADFLGSGPAGLQHAREFASRRRVEGDRAQMNRLYAVESMPTTTGTQGRPSPAAARRSEIEAFARAVAAQLGVAGAGAAPVAGGRAAAWIAPLVEGSAGAPRPQPGHRRRRPAAGGARARARDERGARQRRRDGRLHADRPRRSRSNQLASLRELVGEMNAGTVDLLVILGGNPVYTAPADLSFADGAGEGAAARAPQPLRGRDRRAAATGTFPRRTSSKRGATCARDDGTVSIVQPLIAPLYDGKSAHEVLAAMSDGRERSGYDIVREFWSGSGVRRSARAARRPRRPPPTPPIAAPAPRRRAGPRRRSRRAVRVALAPLAARRRDAGHGVRAAGRSPSGRSRAAPARRRQASGLEIVFRPDPSVYDGRFANNALAAGAAEAAHQADLGQRRADRRRRPPRGSTWSAATSSS